MGAPNLLVAPLILLVRCIFMCPVKQSYEKNVISFIFFELGDKWPIGFDFLTCSKIQYLPTLTLGNCRETKGICAYLDPYTCRVTKEYMTNLGMGRSCVTITHIAAPVFHKIVTYL